MEGGLGNGCQRKASKSLNLVEEETKQGLRIQPQSQKEKAPTISENITDKSRALARSAAGEISGRSRGAGLCQEDRGGGHKDRDEAEIPRKERRDGVSCHFPKKSL